MTYDELIKTICSSTSDDWIHIPEAGAHTFRGDLNIHVRRIDSESDAADVDEAVYAFNQTLGQQARHENPRPLLYEICYGASVVERLTLLTVDNGNARIPAPDPVTRTIAEKDYRIAKALDYLGTLDNYLKHAGFTVEEGT